MSIPQRIALTLPSPRGIQATIDQAVWAEQQGFDDVWFADASGLDALTTAAAVALNTQRVRIGSAIIPVYTRTPPVLAASAYVLNQLSEGRFILGLGSSSQTMMVNFNGQEFSRPLTRVRETAELVRSILTGEKTDFDGETLRSHGYRQPPLPAGAQPIFLAALREKMLEMAAETGDGVILNLFPFDALPKMMAAIERGAARAGKKLEDLEVVCRHMVIVTDDIKHARQMFRRQFVPYYATPVYNRFLAWCGFEEEAAAIASGWASRDRKATAAGLTDEIADAVGILGNEESCHARLQEYAAAGITTHIISCPSADPDDHMRTYAAFTADALPLG